MVYHIGECVFKGDMRLIIGVVRWIPESHRDETSQENYHQNYKKSDMVYIGPHFSEKTHYSPGESADRRSAMLMESERLLPCGGLLAESRTPPMRAAQPMPAPGAGDRAEQGPLPEPQPPGRRA